MRSPKTNVRLDPVKLGVLDLAHRRFGLRSAADLGAVWAVDAGYSLHLAAKPGIERMISVDESFTPAASSAIARRANMREVEGNFAEERVRQAVGRVDAIIMFDVLLHQVAPDWDELIERYAGQASCLILAGPWYRAGRGETIRLLELGEERYLATVWPQELNAGLFERLDEFHPQRGRPWRDVHDIWQWGITDADLRHHVEELGFELAFYENHGTWRSLPAFTDGVYVFARPELLHRRP